MDVHDCARSLGFPVDSHGREGPGLSLFSNPRSTLHFRARSFEASTSLKEDMEKAEEQLRNWEAAKQALQELDLKCH